MCHGHSGWTSLVPPVPSLSLTTVSSAFLVCSSLLKPLLCLRRPATSPPGLLWHWLMGGHAVLPGTSFPSIPPGGHGALFPPSLEFFLFPRPGPSRTLNCQGSECHIPVASHPPWRGLWIPAWGVRWGKEAGWEVGREKFSRGQFIQLAYALETRSRGGEDKRAQGPPPGWARERP